MPAIKIAKVFLGILAITLIPGLVSAQAIMLGHGRNLACSPGIFAACEKNWTEPSLYAGYLYSGDNGKRLSFESTGGNIGGVAAIEQRFPLQGIWVEALAPVRVTDRIGLAVGGAYLFHFEETSRESYRTAAGATPARSWKTNVQWANAQGALTYAVSPSFFALAGFRWSHLVTDFSDPYDPVGMATSLPTDESELKLNGYIPFVGVLTKLGLASQTTASAGVIGFPLLLGTYRYRETVGGAGARIDGEDTFDSGYFVEAFAEYAMKYGRASLGLFGKYGAAAGKSTLDLEVSGGATGVADFDLTLRSQYLVGGGKVSYAF